MKIQMLDLSAQHEPILPEIEAAVMRVIRGGRYILGAEVEEFERELADYCGTRYAVGVSSGTDALTVAMASCGIHRGDEVITTPYTFIATAGSILRAGAVPVFADIDQETGNISEQEARAKVTRKTRAILPVHLFGECSGVDDVARMADECGLVMIEDAAQAIGGEFGGRRAGSFGMAGCFSFFPAKNLGAIGDGGAVTTDSPDVAEKARMIRAHGSRQRYQHVMAGGNYRLDEIQAAVLRVKLRHLDEWTARRRENAAQYRARFAGSLVGMFSPVDGSESACNQFVVTVDAARRDTVRARLAEKGIASEVYYPTPLHLQRCMDCLGYRRGDFPHAEALADRSIALPVWPGLTGDQIDMVADAVLEAVA